MVQVKFFSAAGPSSGVELSGNRIISGYGAGDFGQPVTLGAAQDISWITSSGGIAIGGGLAESGQLNNHKWISQSGVSIASGATVALNTVTGSGDATIRIAITNGTSINVSGAKLYAYDGTNVNNGPSGVWVLSYEIIPQGRSGLGDSKWALIDETNYNYMVDRTPDVGWAASGEFNYFIGLSIRPKLTQPSGLQNFGLYLKFDYS